MKLVSMYLSAKQRNICLHWTSTWGKSAWN